MGSLVGLLISSTGWSEKVSRIVVTLGLVLLVAGACGGLLLAYNHHVINNYERKQETRARPATQRAETERSADATRQARNEQEMHDVIAAAPDHPIAPSSLARGCEQLRRAGKRTSACFGSSRDH